MADETDKETSCERWFQFSVAEREALLTMLDQAEQSKTITLAGTRMRDEIIEYEKKLIGVAGLS